MGWIWENGELVKETIKTNDMCKRAIDIEGQHNLSLNPVFDFNAKIKTIYPKYCKKGIRVCNPEATSFGDVCGNKGCNKVSY
jgi:hypothetical protein